MDIVVKKIVNLVLFLSISVHADSVKGSSQDFLLQQCKAFVEDNVELEFKFTFPKEHSKARDESLYFFDKKFGLSDWIIIDTTTNDLVIENTFKLPIHTLRYKKYLAGQRLLLLGDGKNYTLLEQGAVALKKKLAKEVKIFHGGVDAWLQDSQKTSPLKAKSLLPSEFIVESKLGRWQYIATEGEFHNLLVRFRQTNSKVNPLDRFLLMKADLLQSNVNIPSSLNSALFQIDGGMKALEHFTDNQGIILSAKRAKKLKNQCQKPHES